MCCQVHIKASSLQDMVLFVDPPNKKLYCPLCKSVFTDPVIVSCGVCTFDFVVVT